jgi:hypothetical protein
MPDEMTLRTFARICASSDGPSWLEGSIHKTVHDAVLGVGDENVQVALTKAQEALTHLVGIAGVLDRRLTNIYVATTPFLCFLDDAFKEYLREQEGRVDKSGDALDKAIEVLRLAETLTVRVNEHFEAHSTLVPSLMDVLMADAGDAPDDS